MSGSPCLDETLLISRLAVPLRPLDLADYPARLAAYRRAGLAEHVTDQRDAAAVRHETQRRQTVATRTAALAGGAG